MTNKPDDMWAVAHRYITTERRMAHIREQIGQLHDEAEGLIGQHERDAITIKKALTLAGTPVLQLSTSDPLIVQQGSMLKVVEMARAIRLPHPDATPEPDADTALSDAHAALVNAIEDVNAEAEADEAAAWFKVRVVPGEAVSA
jgi:hypothetical protein